MEGDSRIYSDSGVACNNRSFQVQGVATPADPRNGSSSGSSNGVGTDGRRTSFRRHSNGSPPSGQQQQQQQQALPTPTPPSVRGIPHGGTRNPRRSSEERGVGAISSTVHSSTLSSTVESPQECVGVAGAAPQPTPPSCDTVPINTTSAVAAGNMYAMQASSARASTVPSPVTMSGVARSRTGRAATSETPTGVASHPNISEMPRQAVSAGANAVSLVALTQLGSHIAHRQGPVVQPTIAVAGEERTTNRGTLLNDKASGGDCSEECRRSNVPADAEQVHDNSSSCNNSSNTAGPQPKPWPPQLRPVVVTKSATVERYSASSKSNTKGSNNTGCGGGGATLGDDDTHARPYATDVSSKNLVSGVSPTAAQTPAVTHNNLTATNVSISPNSGAAVLGMESLRTEISEIINPSLMDSAAELDGDVSPEMAEACHGFLQRLPMDWARTVVRAITLQTATLQIPPRLLRAPVIFDTYTELRGEISATLEVAAAAAVNAARATTSTAAITTCSNSRCTHQGSSKASNVTNAAAKADVHVAFPHTVNLLQLLTVAPALLRHRLHNTRMSKVDELRAGFRSNAQTAARTEASVNRYAYLPHVQRDVHYGAVLAQGAPRMMMPGPRLATSLLSSASNRQASASSNNSNAPENGRFSPSVVRNNTATTVPCLTRTYTAVSFENFASLFLKDRFDVAQAERLGGGAGSTSSGNNNTKDHRHGNRRRRRVNPFFERDFVATIAVGQEEAALFTTTLAAEFMVGLPSFLKHPERAVPLSLAASLHHLYSALTMELFARAYTAAARRNAAAAEEAATAAANNNIDNAEMNNSRYPLENYPDTVFSLTPPEALPITPSSEVRPAPLRGPSLELGILYVRNSIVCSASTPGMEAYLVFIHQIVYPDAQGLSGQAPSSSPTPPSYRALLQLSEGANGSMAAPPMPPNARSSLSNIRSLNDHTAASSTTTTTTTPGTFELPTMKHAAVEMTQLVTWVQDIRSHDLRHGQPFSCNLTFVSTHIPDIVAPTPSQLLEPHPGIEMEDASVYPCAVVLGTVDLWKALPPSVVSNFLRVFYVLDRHAQRVMELESPDYGTEEEAAAAAIATAAAAAAKAHDSAEKTMNPILCAIPYPNPQVKQYVASTIEQQARAYVEQVTPLLHSGTASDSNATSSSNSSRPLAALQQRLLSYFMARLRYYEDVNERHCKTDEELLKEELQRMARCRGATTAAAETAASEQQTTNSPLTSSPSPRPPPQSSSSLSTNIYDAYGVRNKSLCDALAVALATEAAAVSSEEMGELQQQQHTQSSSGGNMESVVRSGAAHTSACLSTPIHPGCDSSVDMKARNAEGSVAAPSVVVLLVPQRDVLRR